MTNGLSSPTTGTDRPKEHLLRPQTDDEGIIYRYRLVSLAHLRNAGNGRPLDWHRRLAADGSWDAIHQALTAHAAKNDKVDFTVSVDSTIARAHQHATNISRVKKGLVELQGSADRVA